MPEVKAGWKIVLLKSQNLTDTLTHLDPDSHAAKTVFRLTVPFFVKILGINQLWLYILQFVLGLITIYHLYKISFRILSNAVSSTYITAGIVFLYFGRACFVDFSWYDGWAFFALIMAMSTRNNLLVFLLCSMAAWTDERALIVLPLIILFKQIENFQDNDFSFDKLWRLNKASIFALSAVVLYFLVRMLLTVFFNMHTPSDSANLDTLKLNVPLIGIGIWTFFEGFWVLLLIAFAHMIAKKQYVFFMLLMFQVTVSTLVACSVFDITRSGAYLIPIVFILLIYLKNKVAPSEMNLLLAICCLITFLFPAYYIVGGMNMNQPAYFEFLNFIL